MSSDPLSLSQLLTKYGLRPRKGLGQNFLADPHHLSKIVEAAGLSPDDTVLEIGPGPGTLTRLLAAQAGHVIAVELDTELVKLLQNELVPDHPNLTIVPADILQVEPTALLQAALPGRPTPPAYKVVANLPYYITSAVLRHLLESDPRPVRLVVTVQKEVARRIVAQPGEMSLLAVSIQFYGQPKLVHTIPAGAFYPPPQVDSAVVRIETYAERPVKVSDLDFFFQVVKAGFGQKRKQLKNTLASGLGRSPAEIILALERAGIEPSRRAQTLSLAEWGHLTAELSASQKFRHR
ncbi:MAG TPA: 16S rRNA (adenine(1518)-N(6)/adenine(1519)-N(6))-dimethyltransferase RsmA [Anaerolineae bacterium]|nr:16S rRNA (adenine(1518)-N(6)/adenine(1519)-N(6))-dimethyltransferase RsmA [Anaerolineae bacterium]